MNNLSEFSASLVARAARLQRAAGVRDLSPELLLFAAMVHLEHLALPALRAAYGGTRVRALLPALRAAVCAQPTGADRGPDERARRAVARARAGRSGIARLGALLHALLAEVSPRGSAMRLEATERLLAARRPRGEICTLWLE